MSKSQLEKLFEKASDSFISEMYDVPIQQIQNRRSDFEIKQLGCTINRMWCEEELAQTVKEILRIVSNEYNNGNIPHTNSTPLNSEKEFLYMKATGIVRRIDDLGRIVIPKEIRRSFRIHEGDPLEIFTDAEGEVIFKKYSPIAELSNFAGQYAEVLHKNGGLPIAIVDNDHVIAASGMSKREVLERRITKNLEELMENRAVHITTRDVPPMNAIEGLARKANVVYPIIYGGDVSGAVALMQGDENHIPTETEIKLVQVAAAFLGKQME